MKTNLFWFFLILGGFLLGSIMFSRIIPRIFAKKDVCKLGEDGNPGAANVFTKCGVKLGIGCLLLDILKGFAMPFVASLFMNTQSILFSLVMIAPVLGHSLGLIGGSRGGKCISTSFGVMIGILPISFIGFLLAALYIIFSTMVKINPHSMRSILSFSLFAIISLVWLGIMNQYSLAIGCVVISIIAIIKHALPLFAAKKAEKDEEKLSGKA